jgi:hypothetical protein
MECVIIHKEKKLLLIFYVNNIRLYFKEDRHVYEYEAYLLSYFATTTKDPSFFLGIEIKTDKHTLHIT